MFNKPTSNYPSGARLTGGLGDSGATLFSDDQATGEWMSDSGATRFFRQHVLIE